MGKKILYGIDEYTKDKKKTGEDGTQQVTAPFLASAATPTQEEAPKPEMIEMATPSAQSTQATVSEPVVPATVTPTGTQTGASGTANVNQPLTTVDLAREHMNQARNKVYEILNRKFTFKAEESPLYSILQQQYEKQAQKAAGQAYARAVANTGGYGSSYATLAAEEARRGTMEGFNDQIPALYQAAKDEFLQERQSALDWYSQSRQMYEDALDEQMESSLDIAYTMWGDGDNEEAVRAALAEQGIGSSAIETIISQVKRGYATGLQQDAAISEIKNQQAYNTGANLAATLAGQGKTAEEIRAALVESGTPAAIVDQIMSERLEQSYADAAAQAGLDKIAADARDEAEAKEATDAYNNWLSQWLSNPDETAIRAAMKEAGISDAAINSAMVGFMEYSAAQNEYKAGVEAIEKSARDEAEAKEATDAYNNWLSQWLSNPDETAIRAAMKKTGISDAAINYAMLGFMEYSTIQADYNKTAESTSGGLTTEQKTELGNAATDDYDGTNKNQIETQLKQNGMTQEEADKVISNLEEQEKAALDDASKTVSNISDAVTYKNELDKSKANGTLSVAEYDQRIAENSAKIMTEVTKGLDDLSDMDYEALGISQAEWDGMDDGDKKLSVFVQVGELVKQGIVRWGDYYKMLSDDTAEFFASNEYKNSETPIRDTMDRAIIIQDLRDSGYLLGDDYVSLLYGEILPKIENTPAFQTIVNYANEWKTIKGENLSTSQFFNKLESGNYLAPGVTTTGKDAVKNYTQEEKEIMLMMARFIANRDGPVVNVPQVTPGTQNRPTTGKTGGAHDIHYVRD